LGVIREATIADRAAMEAFLLAHIEVAMFPMANLREHGLGAGGFGSEHPNAARFWLLGPGVRGVVAVTRRGMIMAVLPADADLGELAVAMAGAVVVGTVGEAVATRLVIRALGLAGEPTLRDVDEPGFALKLADLVVPQVAGAELIGAGEGLREMLVEWRAAYHLEVMGTPREQVAALAERDIASYVAAGSHRVLLVAGKPVALTGFNARLPEIVQVGGVYVPPELRGRGYARLAVALHLVEARAQGAVRAVLFAANDAAARAYRAIGFQRTGVMALVLFAGRHTVGA
jgi:RimJ/RimL family protein N-acetyltransferase